MQLEALEMWKDIEAKVGKELLVKTGLLWALEPNTPTYNFVSSQEGIKKMTVKEMSEKWSALKVPEHLTGFFFEEAGICKAKEAL